jgi:hypothetical protein
VQNGPLVSKGRSQHSKFGAPQHWPLPQHCVPAGQHNGLPGENGQGFSPAGHWTHVPAAGSVQV